MPADRPLLDALSKLNVTLSRVDRGNYLNFMLTQQMAERATPTNSTFGSALFNSTTITWVQILQRNARRKYTELVFSNAAFFLVNNTDTESDPLELATLINNASNNGTDVMLGNTSLYSAAPNPIRIETTGPLFIACFNVNPSGPPIVQQGVVTWQEAIYSDLDAIPGFMVEHRHRAGEINKLTTGSLAESILGRDEDFETAYARGGVR